MFRSLLVLAMGAVMPNETLAQIDSVTWNGLLEPAVCNGRVDYSKWRDKPRFDLLIEQIAITDTKTMGRQEKLAFFINAYNILAAQGILAGRSPQSMLGRYLHFKRDTDTVAGQRISLKPQCCLPEASSILVICNTTGA